MTDVGESEQGDQGLSSLPEVTISSEQGARGKKDEGRGNLQRYAHSTATDSPKIHDERELATTRAKATNLKCD